MPRAKGGSIPPPRVSILPGHGGLISTLNDSDVLSGRGGRINNHPGNIAFRATVEYYKHEYLDPRTRKLEKAHVAARLVAQVRGMNPPGRFLKEDGDNPGFYVEIGDQKAWKKAGQALREDAPEIRKEIDDEIQVDEYTPHPVYPMPRMHAGVPPSVSYSPSNVPRGMDPPEAEGVSGYRQPPLPYYSSNDYRPSHYSGRGPPPAVSHHYPAQQQYAPPNSYQYPPQHHPHQQYPQSHYAPQGRHDYYRGMHPPPQRQPQFTSGPRNRFGAPMSNSDRRGDFPSIAMSVGTDFTMSDVSEFTPVSVQRRHEKVDPLRDASLDYLKESTQPLEVTARQSSSDKSTLAVSELSVSGLKASAMVVEPAAQERNESTFTMSLGLSRTYSFPDLYLSTGELLSEEVVNGESNNDKSDPNNDGLNNDDPSNGTKHKKTKSGRLFRQASNHRHTSSESGSIFSVDSLKNARGRTYTEVSGLQDAMSLMSMDHHSYKSEASWLEAAKSMQSISSDMNPWSSGEGNGFRMNRADDGSVRSLLSDVSSDLNALDLAEIPLLPPIQHAESGLEDSSGFIHRPDP